MLATKAVGRFSLVLLIASSFGATVVFAREACSNADFKGRYAFLAEVEDLRSGADTKYPVRFAGTVYSDGNGTLTEWMDTAVAGPPDLGTNVVNERNLVAAAAAAGGKVTYEVTQNIAGSQFGARWQSRSAQSMLWFAAHWRTADERQCLFRLHLIS